MKDYGLQNVTPLLVKVDPLVPDDWDTTKDGGGGTTREEVGHGLKYLPQVRGRIAEGYGPEDFDRLRHSQDADEQALGNSHGMFYGNHPITVERQGDELVTTDGRHRLNLAQQDGMCEIPAHVKAPADDPEFAGKPYDAARSPDGERKQEGNNMNRERYNPIEMPESKPKQEQDPSRKNDPFFTGNWGDSPNDPSQAKTDPMAASDGQQQQSEQTTDSMDGADAAHRPANSEDTDATEAGQSRG